MRTFSIVFVAPKPQLFHFARDLIPLDDWEQFQHSLQVAF